MRPRHLIGHVRVLWRTERIIAELRLKRVLGNLGLQAVAALIAAFALLSFELAAYLALIQIWSAMWAAIALGFFNLVISGLLALLALRRPVSRELAMADEVHQQALAAFEAELHHADANSTRAAIESAAVSLLPIIPVIIARLRKEKTPSKTTD